MAKRFAIAIAVAAAGVMALGAQTATALPTYDTTEVTIIKDQDVVHGWVESEADRCEKRRRVVLFKKRPGADRRLLSTRTKGPEHRGHRHWEVSDGPIGSALQPGDPLYAKAMPKPRRNGYVCRDARTEVVRWEQGDWKVGDDR